MFLHPQLLADFTHSTYVRFVTKHHMGMLEKGHVKLDYFSVTHEKLLIGVAAKEVDIYCLKNYIGFINFCITETCKLTCYIQWSIRLFNRLLYLR